MTRSDRDALESALAAWRGVLMYRIYRRCGGANLGPLHTTLYVRHTQAVNNDQG